MTASTATCWATRPYAAPWTPRRRPPRRSPRRCRAGAPSTCRTARSSSASTSTSSRPTTSSTRGTSPSPPGRGRGSTRPLVDRGRGLVRRAGAPLPRRRHGRRLAPSRTAAPRRDLLAAFGRDSAWGPNHACLASFSAAFGRGDIDAIMALTTDDCVFEATGPAPGRRTARGRGRHPRRVGAAVRRHPGACLHRGGDVRRGRPRRAALALRLGGRRRRRRATSAASTCCGSATGRSARSSPTSRAEPLLLAGIRCVWMPS